MRSLEAGARSIRDGNSFLLFPEGTRSTTGEMLPFKKGGFLMALKAQAPIAPGAISGGTDAMRRGSKNIRPRDTSIRRRTPPESAGMQVTGRAALTPPVRESRARAQTWRARLIVMFLDTYHVEIDGSRNIRKPLVDALDKLIGADDLVAVMTPEMSARDITFARKTTTIDGFLTRYWHWGERGRMIPADRVDEQYGACYPNMAPP